jgi:hypothetical protein
MIDKTFTHADALASLFPGAIWSLQGDNLIFEEEIDSSGNKTGNLIASNFSWSETNPQPQPNKMQLDTEVARLQEEYSTKEYQRQRRVEYPPLADLADALYWQSQGDESKMTAYLAAVDAVKVKYPKGAM